LSFFHIPIRVTRFHAFFIVATMKNASKRKSLIGMWKKLYSKLILSAHLKVRFFLFVYYSRILLFSIFYKMHLKRADNYSPFKLNLNGESFGSFQIIKPCWIFNIFIICLWWIFFLNNILNDLINNTLYI
jgi:hypothetical protein